MVALRSRAKRISLILAVAFALGFINSWSVGVSVVLLILLVPTASLILIVGVLAALVMDARAIDEPRARLARATATIVLAGATIALFFPVAWVGGFTGALTRLAINATTYPTIIDNLRDPSVSIESIERQYGVRLYVDRGPPLRVAFNPEGFLDNWSGIVFDPSGEMMQANGFDATRRFRAPDRITKLFGGDLLSCHRLWGDYYDCAFT